jgi:hypothetical protein
VAYLYVLLAVLAIPGTARAFCRTTTETQLDNRVCTTTGLPLRWERRCISFSVESDDPAVRDAVDRSFATWSGVDCDGRQIGLALRQTEETARCTTAGYESNAPNMNAILFLEDWADRAELPADAFAVTLVWNLKATGEIVDVDMLLNPTIAKLGICADECASQANDLDIQNVVTHEAGHFLGLAHSDVEGATMSASAPVGQTEKRDLTDDDVAGLCAIYGELEPANCTTTAFVPANGFSADCTQAASPDAGCGDDCGQPESAGTGNTDDNSRPEPSDAGSSADDGSPSRSSEGGCSVRLARRAPFPAEPAWIAALAASAVLLMRAHRRSR